MPTVFSHNNDIWRKVALREQKAKGLREYVSPQLTRADFSGDFNSVFSSLGSANRSEGSPRTNKQAQDDKADANYRRPKLWFGPLLQPLCGLSRPPLLTEVGIVVVAGFLAQSPICAYIAFLMGFPVWTPKRLLQRVVVYFSVSLSGVLTIGMWLLILNWPRIVTPYCRPWLSQQQRD